MTIRLFIAVLFWQFIPFFAAAQETRIYSDPHRLYFDALQRFAEGNYTLAQHEFGQYLLLGEAGTLSVPTAYQESAQYHNALCALRLGHPDAEMQLARFIDERGDSPLSGRAYYELGKIYFDKKEYKDLIYCYERVEISDLSEKERGEYFFQFAYSYFVSKDFDKAKGMFSEIINTRNEYYHDANYYYGVLSYFDKQYAKSLESFQRIEENQKYSKIVPYYIALMYHFQKKTDELLGYAVPKTQIKDLRNQKELHQLVGQTFFNKKQYKEALPYLSYYVEKTDKVRKEDLYQLGCAQYQVGEYEKAIGNFTQLNTLQDTLGQNAMYHLADCFLKTNDKSKALNAFDAAAKHKFNPEIQEISVLNHAKLSYELGFHSNAISRFQYFINTYPNSGKQHEAKRLLSELFETTRNYREALNVLDGITAKSPEMQRTYQRVAYLRGTELFNDRKYDDALTMFDKAMDIPIDPNVSALCQFWTADIKYKRRQFEEAFNDYERFLSMAGNQVLSEKASPATAHYAMGYILFKDKSYADAMGHFDDAVASTRSNFDMGNSRAVASQVYPDALLRSADCKFMLRNYPQALEQYEEVIKAGMRGLDYAYYQKAMLQGLTGKPEQKISALQKMGDKFPGSDYNDDAIYQTAITQVGLEQYDDAIVSHQKLIADFPESEYVRKSLVNLGLIYFNKNDYTRSLEFYELTLRRFPKTDEAREALAGARDVFIAQQDVDGYAQFVRKSGMEVSTSEQDSLSYQVAESFYAKADCANAIKEFGKYLNNYPKGVYVLYAHFYRGQCLYSQEEYGKAGKDFDYIVQQPASIFSEQSLDKSSRIALNIEKDYEKGYLYSRKLYEIGARKELKLEALRNLVFATYQLKKDDELSTYSDLLQTAEGVTEDDISNIYFYAGMSAYRRGDTAGAKSNLQETARRTTNEKGAQARYYLAKMAFEAKKYDIAKDLCFKVNTETGSQEYWVVKAFILLADVYKEKNDLFQAKATLQSILDNYAPEDDAKKEAREKLAQLQKQESSKSKLQDSKPKNGKYLEMDEGK